MLRTGERSDSRRMRVPGSRPGAPDPLIGIADPGLQYCIAQHSLRKFHSARRSISREAQPPTVPSRPCAVSGTSINSRLENHGIDAGDRGRNRRSSQRSASRPGTRSANLLRGAAGHAMGGRSVASFQPDRYNRSAWRRPRIHDWPSASACIFVAPRTRRGPIATHDVRTATRRG